MMLETIREYGLELLEARGEAERARERHAEWLLRFAEDHEPRLEGAEQTEALHRLDAENENLRAALDWFMFGSERSGKPREDAPGLERAMRMASALWRFWMMRSYLAEGRRRLEGLLALKSVSARTPLRAKTLHAAGMMAYRRADFEATRKFQEEAIEIYGEIGDARGTARSLNCLGAVSADQGDFQGSDSYFGRSLELARAQGDRMGQAKLLNNLAALADMQGDHDRARALYEESLELSHVLGDGRGTGLILFNLGVIARAQQDLPAASARFEESLAIMRGIGEKEGIGLALHSLGLIARAQGRYGPARSLLRESLEVHREIGDRRAVALSLEGLAALACSEGRHERAARIFGAAEALREALAAPMPPGQRLEHETHLVVILSALGEAPYALALETGRGLAFEAAVDYALEAAEGVEEGRAQPSL